MAPEPDAVAPLDAPIPYATTAAVTRPAWSSLPEAVRGAVETWLGARVQAAASAGGGFTAGFAARLVTTDGRRAFVKAESLTRNPVIADCYRREAAVNAALPAGLPAPRVRWSADVDDWVVLDFDDVAGRMPDWRSADDLAAVLRLASEVADCS